MEERYTPQKIEQKWQSIWDKEGTFGTTEDPSKEKFYILEMFPYPSGRIHMGHVRNYSIGDVVARFKRMHGYNVLHPMGWDAFGLPAENAAIQNRSHPAKWTYENISYMREQLKKMGLSYDWSREVATCHPDYYRWEQLVFVRMYEKGLVYKKTSPVNWCGSCQTVLANEQVSGDGECWRCDGRVVQKELQQWFFRITEYADELLEFTGKLPGWPERVLTMQKNWIGKSIGAGINFRIDGSNDVINVFTTRPDTLFGATFMSLAPEHPMVEKLSSGTGQEKLVGEFVERARRLAKIVRTDEMKEKEGIFTGGYAINPANGEKIPVYAANFVLMEYGTGAVMAVPAHDQRDFEFAKKYGIPVKVVIEPEGKKLYPAAMTEAFTGSGVMADSGDFSGMQSRKAKRAITDFLDKNGTGKTAISYRLRDWGISRQRYWGAPIPMINCGRCGAVPVPEKDLPVRLPEDVNFDIRAISPLAGIESFVNTTCPSCGGEARRETDTMDTFVESSWYYARYVSPRYTDGPVDREKADYWLPVDQYIGGVEHAVMHLLYARFFHKVLRDIGMVSGDEPFTNLLTQGMVCMESQSCPEHGWLSPEEEVDGRCIKCDMEVIKGRTEKMSKSRKNTVDPDHLIGYYGADTARVFSLFAAPPEKDLEWNEAGVEGAYRFLNRIWRMVYSYQVRNAETAATKETKSEVSKGLSPESLRRTTHRTIKKVTGDINRFHFNTAISAIMELVNEAVKSIESSEYVSHEFVREAVETVVMLLSPFAPHIAEELWQEIGKGQLLAEASWPVCDPSAILDDETLIVVQVNGKLRGRITVAADATDEAVKASAMTDENVKRSIAGFEVKKVVVVPKKLVNIVAAK